MTMLKNKTPETLTDLAAALAASDRQRALSRRAQALMAAAGMDWPERHWYVLTTARAMDAAVGEKLAFANVECWLPHIIVTPRKHRGRNGAAPAPYPKLALPGYVFACVAASSDAWAALAGIRGVTGILGSAGRPLKVGPAEMRAVRGFIADGGAAADILLHTPKVGDPVRIADGPLCDHTGTLGKIDGKGHAHVDILLFGRITPVRLDLAQLAKL